jgi:hypothetical protein
MRQILREKKGFGQGSLYPAVASERQHKDLSDAQEDLGLSQLSPTSPRVEPHQDQGYI